MSKRFVTTMCRTTLRYQTNASLHKFPTKIVKIQPFASLPDESQSLFKAVADDSVIVITTDTIFHPQGGGQPSDTGSMRLVTPAAIFEVAAVRHDPAGPEGPVLHLGRFISTEKFYEGAEVEQAIDVEKRQLYSRLHTAGHVLGVAVRDVCKSHVPGFAELKASHYPEQASCEFRGLIEGKFKDAIQARVDELVANRLPVEVEWWEEKEFSENQVEMPDPNLIAKGEKFRVVRIVGAEVYPCGGTHVKDTGLCGKIIVKKISRAKGVSRVSYNLP